MSEITKISVRNLISNQFLSGDIKFAFVTSNRAVLGTKAHIRQQKKRPANYKAEYAIKHLFEEENIEVFGRIDGIFEDEKLPIIEEIKSTTLPLYKVNLLASHQAQALVYAYLYCLVNKLKKIAVRITYVDLYSDETKCFDETFTFAKLKKFFNNIFYAWLVKHKNSLDVKQKRNISLVEFDFPFNNFRKGQRNIAVDVYKTIENAETKFISAPCGTGKTAGVIFPSLKALGHNKIDRIFYLTAKNSGKKTAIETVKLMQSANAKFSAIEITAKRKICPTPDVACDSDFCPLAKGYYNKLNKVLQSVPNFGLFDEDFIKNLAEQNQMCPFELSLDLSLYCDFIIIDYNYAFDPQVYLLRFFEEIKDKYLFLVDEAHNLPDRARDMFSAEINKQNVVDLKKALGKNLPKIRTDLNKINKYLLEKRKETEKHLNYEYFEEEKPKEFIELITNFTKKAEKYLEKNEESDFKEELLDFYFTCKSFYKISEFYSSNYTTIYKKQSFSGCVIKMYCLDCSIELSKSIKKTHSTIIFSATLNPAEYFFELILGSTEQKILNIQSPFNPKNALYLLQNLNVKYQNRENSSKIVAETIINAVTAKKGNYLIFFPSYAYINKVAIHLEGKIDFEIQNSNMTDIEKTQFLQKFTEDSATVALAVMGGSFSEGIDLLGNRLIGVIIVSVCLPKICLERDLIKKYYDENKLNGFDFAYKYPGFNKVTQSVGRLIRTKTDKGVAILIDERYFSYGWQKMFPRHWLNIKKMFSGKQVPDYIENFYKEIED